MSAIEFESVLPSYEELFLRSANLSGTSWELFGEKDELGTLNLLTSQRTQNAASLIREGRRIGLNLALDTFDPPLIPHRGNPQHTIFGLNEFHRDDKLDNFFMQASTQLDGLRHFAHPDRGFYGGRSASEIAPGSTTLGIDRVAQRGIIGRGILLDVARYRSEVGRPIDHRNSETISAADMESTAQSQGITFQTGDILLLRTGWLEHIHNSKRVPGEPVHSAGLAPTQETAAWLWDNHFSVVAADNIAVEAWPVADSEITTEAERRGTLEISSHTGMLHRILIPLLGITLGELWDFEALSKTCQELGRYEVFISAMPLNLVGGVGSPANALAIL